MNRHRAMRTSSPSRPISRRPVRLLGVLGPLALLAVTASCGSDDARSGSSTGAGEAGTVEIDVSMSEFAFTPSTLEVAHGTKVRFNVTNTGTVGHELVIGDTTAQEDAEKAMRSSDGMNMHDHGDGAPTLFLNPGESGTVEYTFDEPAELLIGCHVSGHWDSGMRGTLTIT